LNSEPTFLNPCYKMLILNFNLPPCSHFSFFAKVVLLKVVHRLTIYRSTKFDGPTLTGASFTSASKIWTSSSLERLQLRYWKLLHWGHLQCHDLCTEFHKICQLVQKFIGGQIHRHKGDYISLLSSFRKEIRLKRSINIGLSRYSSYSFLTSAKDGLCGQRHAPAALYPRYPLGRRLAGSQIWSGHRGYRRNTLPLPRTEPLSSGHPVRTQTLYCLSYPSCYIYTDIREIGLGCVDWIRLSQDRDRWRAVVSAVMNLLVLTPRS
jgi:hypothetical protein